MNHCCIVSQKFSVTNVWFSSGYEENDDPGCEEEGGATGTLSLHLVVRCGFSFRSFSALQVLVGQVRMKPAAIVSLVPVIPTGLTGRLHHVYITEGL